MGGPTNFINETPEAINTIILGDLNTNIHERKPEEEENIGPHIWEGNRISEKQGAQYTCRQDHRQRKHDEPPSGNRHESDKHILPET